jgi:hypothetical protein|nr:MAG TPA: protein of unknown function (DUF4969) [Bacteriophage sp.]
MKTKIYYLFLLVMFFLMSCEGKTSNVSESKVVGTLLGMPILERTIDGHDYINVTKGYTHSGTYRKCKQERDSIINVIINEIRNGKE